MPLSRTIARERTLSTSNPYFCAGAAVFEAAEAGAVFAAGAAVAFAAGAAVDFAAGAAAAFAAGCLLAISEKIDQSGKKAQ